ncbi:MAG: DNA recombination protein RmuC, partial [Rikenellaceae bacterium]|nr:DNA recombination protein RmuC [Rikenellaceae bacterium]
MEITYTIIALLLVVCAVLATLLVGRNRDIASQRQRLDELSEELVAADNRIAEEQNRAEEFRRQREAEQMARVKAEADLAAERRSVEERERQQQDLERSVREQFKALAGDVLGEQSRRFKEENRESMDVILKPFKDNISEFRRRVEDIYSHQTEQSGALKNELQRLMELNVKITAETTNLTNALKGN